MAALNNSAYQYVGSVEYAAVTQWAASAVKAAGVLIRPLTAPAAGNERVYVATTGGTTGVAEPTWTFTKGAIQPTDGTVVWQECTGQPGVNGDITNSPVWGATLTVVLGQIIYDSGTASLQIANQSFTTAGSTPTFSATAGVTSTGQDIGKWTSLGLASAFTAFAAPHIRILNADAATWQTVNPATVYIASDHAYSIAAALTLAGGTGTAASPTKYISVNKATVPPTASSILSGASEATTGLNTLTRNGYGYYNGITFSSGSGGSNAVNLVLNGSAGYTFDENCTYNLATTGTQSILMGGNSVATGFTMLNPTFIFGSTTQTLAFQGGSFTIINPTVAQTGSVPSVLTRLLAGGGTYVIRDGDLSKITGTLTNNNSASASASILFENCKLGAAVAMTSNSFLNASTNFILHNCDSGNKNYRFYQSNYLGTIQQETTVVDNNNPANNGNQSYSWSIATTANTALTQPYISPEIAQWCNLTSGTHTATVQINSNVALTNAQIWMELEYLGSSSTPIGTSVTSRVSNVLSTPTTYTTSSDSWGGALSNQQYMQVSFTPAMAGYIKVRIYIAVPSTTVYVSPLILVV